MADSVDAELKHKTTDDKRNQQSKKAEDAVIQPRAPSHKYGDIAAKEGEGTENPNSLPVDHKNIISSLDKDEVHIDKTVHITAAHKEDAENESKSNASILKSLNTEHAASLTPEDLQNISKLTVANEVETDTEALRTEGSTTEGKPIQSNALNDLDICMALPLEKVESVPMSPQLTENIDETAVKQNHVLLKSTGSEPSGASCLDVYDIKVTAPDEIKSSEGSVVQLTPLNKERLTIDITDVKEISKNEKMPSLSSVNTHPQSKYELKKIPWYTHVVPIVTQNENGPCPLIAITNILLLRRKIVIPLAVKEVTAEELMEYVANCIMENIPRNLSGTSQLNYEQNMHDAIGVLPRLLTGLDVNIRFTGVRDFEYTTECIIFDLLNIPLYHGWLVDPQAKEVVDAIGSLGYNQLVEKIILNKFSNDSDCVTQALTAEMFLENSATQLTYHGLCELNSTMISNELAVLFRNNHFSTIYKRKNELFQLVTDQGFLNEPRVIWEVLCNIEGDSMFVDGKFSDSPKVPEAGPGPDVFTPLPQSVSKEQQIKHDFLVALSLQEDQTIDQKSDEPWEGFEDVGSNSEVSSVDLELARCMQESYQQDSHTGPSSSPSSKHLRSPDRKKKESGCTIL